MSYGQPCRRMTGGPLAGPATAYPTFRSPASICFMGANDVFVPGVVGPILPDCASAAPTMASSATATVRTAAPKRRRRSWLISSDILALLNWIQGDVVRRGVEVRARVVPEGERGRSGAANAGRSASRRVLKFVECHGRILIR